MQSCKQMPPSYLDKILQTYSLEIVKQEVLAVEGGGRIRRIKWTLYIGYWDPQTSLPTWLPHFSSQALNFQGRLDDISLWNTIDPRGKTWRYWYGKFPNYTPNQVTLQISSNREQLIKLLEKLTKTHPFTQYFPPAFCCPILKCEQTTKEYQTFEESHYHVRHLDI